MSEREPDSSTEIDEAADRQVASHGVERVMRRSFERTRRYETYFNRLCRLFDTERARVAPRTRFDRAIT
jgi:hypothetical protein